MFQLDVVQNEMDVVRDAPPVYPGVDLRLPLCGKGVPAPAIRLVHGMTHMSCPLTSQVSFSCSYPSGNCSYPAGSALLTQYVRERPVIERKSFRNIEKVTRPLDQFNRVNHIRKTFVLKPWDSFSECSSSAM